MLSRFRFFPLSVLLLLSFGFAFCTAPLAAKDAYRKLSLEQLGSFPCDSPEVSDSALDAWVDSERNEARRGKPVVIPLWIKKLDGNKVAVSGFMMPSQMDEDAMTSFILVKSIMNCCFGVAPRVNENVICMVPEGKKFPLYINIPVYIFGILHVDPIKDEEGNLAGIYSMDVEKIEKIEHPDPSMMVGAPAPRP